MSTGAKVTIAIVVLFAVVLGVYYGFAGPGPGPVATPLPSDPVVDPAPGEQLAREGPVGGGIFDESLELESALLPPAQSPGRVLAMDLGNPETTSGLTAAVSAALESTSPDEQTTEYTVQMDDSMWTIAEDCLGDAGRWADIAAANPLVDPHRLTIGQVLRLPPKAPARVAAAAAHSQLSLGGSLPVAVGTLYTVRSGDTLSRIAEAHYGEAGKWLVIYNANRPTIGWDPDRLKVGARLRIPPQAG